MNNTTHTLKLTTEQVLALHKHSGTEIQKLLETSIPEAFLPIPLRIEIKPDGVFNILEGPFIQRRNGLLGKFQDVGFYLDKRFDFKIEKDFYGESVLVAYKK